MKAKRKVLTILIVIVTALACATLMLKSLHHHLAHVEYGEGVASVKWLPAEATNVSFYLSYNYTAFEFDIDERGFKEWVKPHEVQRIEGGFRITRYNFPENRLRMGRVALDSEDYEDVRERYWRLSYMDITNGYKHKKLFGRSGGRRHIAYDLSTGRAYYQHNPR